MKIAYFLPSLAQKGPIIVARDIISEIIKDTSISVVVYYFDDIVEIDFPCPTIKTNMKATLDLDQYDILHSHMLRPDIFILKHYLCGKITSAKTLTTIHQYNYQSLKYTFRSRVKAFLISHIWDLIVSKHDRIVTLSRDMTEYYKKRPLFISKNITFIYNGRPEQTLSKSYNFKSKIPADAKVIGTSCLLTARKGLEQVIKALPKLENYYFFILGEGSEQDSLKALAQELKVEQRVFFLGFQSEPLNHYHLFDVFVLPSRSEGFPLALIEAASCRKPCIVSDIPIFRETFTPQEVTFFDLDNIDSLAAAIRLAYSQKKQFANAIYLKYLNNYTAKVMANKYLEAYKDI